MSEQKIIRSKIYLTNSYGYSINYLVYFLRKLKLKIRNKYTSTLNIFTFTQVFLKYKLK